MEMPAYKLTLGLRLVPLCIDMRRKKGLLPMVEHGVQHIVVCLQTDPGAYDILVEGPTIVGEFFVRDRCGNVWTGRRWRGFGMPKMYATFHKAFVVACRIKKAKAAK